MRVIWPDEFDCGTSDSSDTTDAPSRSSDSRPAPAAYADGEPAILPFPTWKSHRPGLDQPGGIAATDVSPAERAKIIHRNRLCRSCQRAFVSLILADDGRRDGTGNFVAGTQTLFGFHCDSCHAEWPADAAQPELRIASTSGI